MYFLSKVIGISLIFSLVHPDDLMEHNREGINNNTSSLSLISGVNTTLSNTQKPYLHDLKNSTNKTVDRSSVISEGGILSLSHPRDQNTSHNLLKVPQIKVSAESNQSLNLTKSLDIKPVQDSVLSSLDIAPKHDDGKPSVPKKGVQFHEPEANETAKNYVKYNKTQTISDIQLTNTSKIIKVSTNQTSSTNTTVIHKKPLVTVSDSDFINMSILNEDSKETIIPKDQIDPMLADKKMKRSDYIVP